MHAGGSGRSIGLPLGQRTAGSLEYAMSARVQPTPAVTIKVRQRIALGLLTLGLAAAGLIPGAVSAQSVAGEPLRIENAKPAAALAFKAATLSPAATLRFQPLADSRITALQRYNATEGGKRLQIGITRRVADEAEALLPQDLPWVPVNGGQVLRFALASPGAAALRVGLDPRGLPEGAELRVASAAGGPIEGADLVAMRSGVDAEGLYWTPVTDGDTQSLELFLPNLSTAADPVVRAVSHLVTSPLRSLDFRKALGTSGACNIDVACRTTALGLPFVNAENAVARMVFSSGGGTFTCTGTLLNDSTPATQVPYFYSAAHCISLQTEASTLSTFWNYETPTCGVNNAGPNTQLTGGADLLFASLANDALLLRLRATPPAGAFLVGWNATALAPATPVIAIHHPDGDIKKYSRGVSPGSNSVDTGAGIGSFVRANWLEGTTEGGSSGSGLFTLVGNQYLLRGGLYGGTASCANSGGADVIDGNQDFYSRFDLVYPSMAQWLGTFAGPLIDHTGAWFFPSEPGWGLTVFNYPGQMFALFFVYDSAGRPAWYRMQGPWTGTNTITAVLDRPNAPAWANSFNAGAITYTTVGSATISFSSASAATLTFNDGTVNRTVALSKLQ